MGRQLTINLFFLVLLALLCRQVHVKFAPPYMLFDSTLQRDIRQTQQDNLLCIDFIARRVQEENSYNEWVLPLYDTALAVQSQTSALFDFLQGYKQKISSQVAAHPNDRQGRMLVRELFITQKGWSEICRRLDTFSKRMLFYWEYDTYARSKELSFVRQDSLLAAKLFCHLPLSGAVVVLSALQYNVMFCGHAVLQHLQYASIPKDWGWCNTTTVIAIPAFCYVIPGDTVTASIFFAAYEKRNDITGRASEGKCRTNNDGVILWQGIANGIGKHRIKGSVTAKIGDSTITRDWSVSFLVGTGMFGNISFDKTNVCYRGIPCTISLSTELYPVENLSLRVPGAVVKKITAGSFEISVPENAPGKLQTYTDAQDAWGGKQTIARLQLTVKDAPPPAVAIAGSNEEGISVTALQESTGLVVTPALEDLQYEIMNYQLILIRKGHADEEMQVAVTGSAFPREALTGIAPGDRLLITDIVVRDQYGHNYSVSPFSVRVR